MYTPDPDIPAKPHQFMSKRLGISISLVLFVLVLLLSYALCSLQVDRSTQAILADKNRFLLSRVDTMQIRLQTWRRAMLEQTNTLALSESVRLFATDMTALPPDLLDKNSRTAAPGSGSDQLSLLDQREYMQQLLADIAYQNDLDRIRIFLPDGHKIVDSASAAADSHDDDLLVRQTITSRTLSFGAFHKHDDHFSLQAGAPLFEISGKDSPRVVGCLLLCFPMDAALTNILQDKESQLRLVDLFPDRSSVFLLQDGALQRLPLRAGVAGAHSLDFKKRPAMAGGDDVYSLAFTSSLPNTLMLVASLPAADIDREILDKSLQIYAAGLLTSLGVGLLLAFGVSCLVGRAHRASAAYFKALYTVIRDQKRVLDSVNDSMRLGLVLFSATDGVRIFNPEFAKICGRTRQEELAGRSPDELFPQEAARKLQAGIERKIKEPSFDGVELALPGPGGKEHLYRVSLYVFLERQEQEAETPTATTIPGSVVAIFKDITRFRRQAQKAQERQQHLMEALVRAVEYVDPNLVGHTRKMQHVAELLARHMALDETAVLTLRMASQLSQIGKIFVPHHLLRKSGKLTPEEQQAVLQSSEYAFRVLYGINFGLPVPDALHDMNEKFDGSGPRALRGDQINPHARLLAVVNAFCSMVSDRAYRQGMPIGQALDILSSSPAFDPAIVLVLREIPEDALRSALSGEDSPSQA
ncbi:HD domain-containing phosphohydrolase [uncultured Desulfovibrio sp.]|uniref:HD domain-containing phosphohydrolase n=1 Tax=uncultured Desulfovibrio sp. TaxID=167968 RepID=UPI00265C9DC3|nr:HD domain-containing phosphohydrolase [uncultured Desulfovibrio sp.]